MTTQDETASGGGAVTKPSAVERVKAASQGLKGTIAGQLTEPAPTFADGGEQLLKFHGIYQGYDRDTATERKQAGQDKDHEFMARVRIPGGRLTAAQWLALDDLATRYGHGSLRLTTRQAIQFHGLVKSTLKPTLRAVNEALLTTFSTCGDVVRNVTTTPAPKGDAVHQRLEADARLLSERLLPKSRGYHEIWVDGEPLWFDRDAAPAVEDGAPVEPLYGRTYLPRKFKIGIATPEDNTVDVLTNDLGIIALFEDQDLVGYNIAVGGGFGMTHNKPKTYPRMASPVVFVGPDELLAAAEAVIRVQRDFGDRSDRKHARLKYLVDERGLDWFKQQLDREMGRMLEHPRPMPAFQVPDHLGWHQQADERWWLGLPVASGRVRDQDGVPIRTALRTLFERHDLTPIVTPQQDLFIADVPAASKGAVEAILKDHGVRLAEGMRPLERWALACVALPSCGLALTEAERVRDPILAQVQEALDAEGLGEERISLRITGCPNGCARPYGGDIGLVGRIPGFYALYLGGDFEGTRLNAKLIEKVPIEKLGATLQPLFGLFRAERRPGEGFGDFCHRAGADRLLATINAASMATV